MRRQRARAPSRELAVILDGVPVARFIQRVYKGGAPFAVSFAIGARPD